MPPNIAHRFSNDSNTGMHDFMMTVDHTMVSLSKLAPLVVRDNCED